MITEYTKAWILIIGACLMFAFAYGYELEHDRRVNAAASLAAYCAREDSVKSLCGD